MILYFISDLSFTWLTNVPRQKCVREWTIWPSSWGGGADCASQSTGIGVGGSAPGVIQS